MKEFSTVAHGVMVVKDGRAWGLVSEDGRSAEEGWVEMSEGSIYDPKFCKKPTDVTYVLSPKADELKDADIVEALKTTVVIVNEPDNKEDSA